MTHSAADRKLENISTSPVSVTTKHPLSREKYRCYPCQNFIISGGCPYYERCTFLHDPRLSVKRVVKRLSAVPNDVNSYDNDHDTFYWPDIVPRGNCYNIPEYFASNVNSQHNCGIFSLCELVYHNYFHNYFICYNRLHVSGYHFVDYVYKTYASNFKNLRFHQLQLQLQRNDNANEEWNMIVANKPRLAVFIHLARGNTLRE